MNRKFLGLAAMSAIAFSAVSADALSLRLTDANNGVFGDADDIVVVIDDNGIGDSNPNGGLVSFDGAVGSYMVQTTSALTDNSATEAFLNQVVNIQSQTSPAPSGRLRIESTDSNYVLASGAAAFTAQFDVNGTRFNESATALSFFNASNTEFATDDLIGSAVTVTQASQNASSSDLVGPASPFGLTILTDIMHGAGGRVTSYDAGLTISAVPLPASVMLLLSAVAGLGFVSRRYKSA